MFKADNLRNVNRYKHEYGYKLSRPSTGKIPSHEEKQILEREFPNLVDGEWWKTGESTGISGHGSYNCYAWSLCRKSLGWIDHIIDILGNNNRSLDTNDFDNFYSQKKYFVCGHSIDDCKHEQNRHKIALFCKDGRPAHVAKESKYEGWWESKLGGYIRIIHKLDQLEGRTYGTVCRCYCLVLERGQMKGDSHE